LNKAENLPPRYVEELLDFAGYLEQKAAETGRNHIPNAITIAAMEEVMDMASGKIPSKSYASAAELSHELDEEDEI
jgi:hypothetical protein